MSWFKKEGTSKISFYIMKIAYLGISLGKRTDYTVTRTRSRSNDD